MQKKETDRKAETTAAGIRPPQEEMQTAYQVHTLAQMLYGQLTPNPWVGPPMAFDPTRAVEVMPWGVVPPVAWPGPVWMGPMTGPYYPMPTIHGFGGFPR